MWPCAVAIICTPRWLMVRAAAASFSVPISSTITTCPAAGSLRTDTQTEIRRARMAHLQGESSCRRAEEEEDIQRRWCLITMTPLRRVVLHGLNVGPDGCRSPRHRMPFV